MEINGLREKPFNLNDQDMDWVRSTFGKMTVQEKIGQLFFMVGYKQDEQFLKKIAQDVGIGGLMCRAMAAGEVTAAVTTLQQSARIPLLIAANLEAGGQGITKDGTKVGSNMAVAATGNTELAYQLGRICAVEGRSVGANYAFAPVIDIDYNFRNPITNTRTFGNDPQRVLEMGSAYVRGCQEQGMAVSIKHFPGDGMDERDQHLVTSVNPLSPDAWDHSYGMVYRHLIEEGAKTVMVGHIALPEYSKLLNPALRDEDILPASLASELLNGLLRERLGFNGLIITDATTMAGMNIAMPRNELVPRAIEHGCDMFLFTKNLEEDVRFMREGLENGLLTDSRLDEAVLRILGLKASLKLHEQDNVPVLAGAAGLLRQESHLDTARAVADQSITLVKEEAGVLPVTPARYPRVLLYDIESEANALGYNKTSGLAAAFIPLLEQAGFKVARFEPAGVYEGLQSSFTEMKDSYDLIIYLCNLATKSNQTAVRIEWLNPMGVNVPNYIHSIPTLFISTENPYHLLDVPRVKTYINTYGINDYTLPLLIEKLMGTSQFKGSSPVDPFCGKWDTRL
ncbi:glycoside hydrolase family 3 N-terminal domain-containing protein [Paenibacillus sp. MMS20-IR301]|uniref:glycoside hydrolase family 3 protein n=1 Tax=Paenibacillus sp. MMS20-IR301 TaxID=2895946 RepID=UPI0028E9215F|nr:glycoside hydrolase family 3 N-terminal domain-containing protein [Paenibacillus sp. MMS20-IR301]WNS46673.1 glycoside hydrolase family 3 N-terminal domain-containing protein [Paenibacillus sp. MMS20-IR301]